MKNISEDKFKSDMRDGQNRGTDRWRDLYTRPQPGRLLKPMIDILDYSAVCNGGTVTAVVRGRAREEEAVEVLCRAGLLIRILGRHYTGSILAYITLVPPPHRAGARLISPSLRRPSITCHTINKAEAGRRRTAGSGIRSTVSALGSVLTPNM